MQICTSGPVGQWRTLLQAAIFTVANAKKYVFIQTPYFLPTEGLNQALQIAALGGVDVRLMLPKRSDTRTANMATHSFIDEMVKAGVKVYFYKPGFLHSKLMVADDELTASVPPIWTSAASSIISRSTHLSTSPRLPNR